MDQFKPVCRPTPTQRKAFQKAAIRRPHGAGRRAKSRTKLFYHLSVLAWQRCLRTKRRLGRRRHFERMYPEVQRLPALRMFAIRFSAGNLTTHVLREAAVHVRAADPNANAAHASMLDPRAAAVLSTVSTEAVGEDDGKERLRQTAAEPTAGEPARSSDYTGGLRSGSAILPRLCAFRVDDPRQCRNHHCLGRRRFEAATWRRIPADEDRVDNLMRSGSDLARGRSAAPSARCDHHESYRQWRPAPRRAGRTKSAIQLVCAKT